MIDGRLKELQASADSTAVHVRNVFFFFLTYGLYLAVTAGATTHEQLLREAPVSLPILNVDIPLFGFYWIGPALFVLLHFNLMLQFYLLARKLREFEQALVPLPKKVAHREYLSGLDSFAFSHMLIGRHHSRVFRTLFRLIVWTTMIILPVILLLGVQVRFLPYHDAATTNFHRILVALDLLLLWIIWRQVISEPNAAGSADRPNTTNRALRMLRRWRRVLRLRYTSFAALTLLAGLSSLFLFTFPGDPSDEIGDPLEELLLGWVPADSSFVTRDRGSSSHGLPPAFGPTAYLFETFPTVLSRNLQVTETNLVTVWPTKEQIEEFGEHKAWQNFGGVVGLRRRDLRYGVFSDSTLVHADLRTTNLQGASLGSANLQGADLRRTNLQDADLWSANLQGAALGGGNLQRASLRIANLQGASLRGANLQGADLLLANLQGAFLRIANLHDASLPDANLQGASLNEANLQGAVLAGANLQGASLGRANLQGADLAGTNLQGADLAEANFQGTDLRRAQLWQATIDQEAERYRLSDWRDLDLDPPSPEDLNQWIETAKTEITDEETRASVTNPLERLKQRLGDDWTLAFPPGLADRTDVLFEPVPAPAFSEFDPQLADFLIKLACGNDTPPSIARRIRGRAVREREDGRVYPALVARALLDTENCPPARELPDPMIADLEKVRVAEEESKTEAAPELETPSWPLVGAPPAKDIAPAAGP